MIQDENLTEAISELLLTLQEAAIQLLDFVDILDAEKFDIVAEDILTGIRQIGEISAPFKRQDENIRLTDACKCAFDSLKRIIQYRQNGDWDKAGHKIEFEFFPILEVAYIQFRYWGCAYPDQEKIEQFKANELANFTMNRYVEQAEQIGEYRYDLSISITAYNKLKYTEQCVESLLKNLPENVTYELVLFNHGSTDDTKRFFERIKPTKQLDLSINGAVKSVINRIYEGKYVLKISNDVLVTPNSINNMMKCIQNDCSVGWIVPTTSNVSNLQSISANYGNLSEMYSFASRNNKFDVRKHEQRVRLCNPMVLTSNIVNQQMLKELYVELFCSGSMLAFPDDKCSLWLRRHHYKLILSKDAYCHHFGSVTINDEVTQKNEKNVYLEGRKHFTEQFGIDPWCRGFCYDPALFAKLSCQEKKAVNILGINCGLGSNPLKIKETIKENTGNQAVTIYNYIKDERYAMDLQGVSDHVVVYCEQKELQDIATKVSFDYIVVESDAEQPAQFVVSIKALLNRLADDGRLCIKVADQGQQRNLMNKLKQAQLAGSWLIITK